jgi:pimeloyl-ACP methyl ester carboxylesterase
VIVVLLPGMDGTGTLFTEFARFLPEGTEAKSVRYPQQEFLTYKELAEKVARVLPQEEPFVIVAESYSGPVAVLLAARQFRNLQAVVFVSSFVAFPCGHPAAWVANLIPSFLFRWTAPFWLLRWLMTDFSAKRERLVEIQTAISSVAPEVLARRVRDALNADFSQTLQVCKVRQVCLFAESDRLLGTRGRRGFLAVKPEIETLKIAGPHLLLQCRPAESLAALQGLGLFTASAPPTPYLHPSVIPPE